MTAGGRNFDRTLDMLLPAHLNKVVVCAIFFRIMARRLRRSES
jgi:hypothetical protein